MNKTVKPELKQYEAPAVQDIELVTIVQGNAGGPVYGGDPDDPGNLND